MNILRIDAEYRNTNNFRAASDEFNKFFRFSDGRGINNTSGFRPKSRAGGSTVAADCVFCVLVTNLGEIEWPDVVDRETGSFTYYGDNRSPGKLVTDTNVGGNLLLERSFSLLHGGDRSLIPPFLCFESFQGSDGKYMRFLGLAAPGAMGLSQLDDLVAVWRIREDARFQNYRAIFTILKESEVHHDWLEDLVAGVSSTASTHCPKAWKTWVVEGRYEALRCERKNVARTKDEQRPRTKREEAVLSHVFGQLTDRDFEFAVAALLPLMDSRYVDIEVTRAVRDGGRDVLARFRVGHEQHQIFLNVYVEAKRWEPTNAVGVKPLMRLMSRLKHRDFGVFVTTSFFHSQVQEELIEDRHPVLLVSGGDLARIVIANELEGAKLAQWLAGVSRNAGAT